MKTVWAVMRESDPVHGMTFRFELFDSEEKAKKFVDGIVDATERSCEEMSARMETSLCTCLSHRDFSIVDVEVK